MKRLLYLNPLLCTILSCFLLIHTIGCNSAPDRQQRAVADSIKKLRVQLKKGAAESVYMKQGGDFLLSNMPYHGYESGDLTTAFVNIIKHCVNNEPALFRETDSVIQLNLLNSGRREDALVMDTGCLNSNLRDCFFIYNQCAWKKDIAAGIVNDYLLPYRIDREPLEKEGWRRYFTDLYFRDKDSAVFTLSLEEAVAVIHSWMYARKKEFKILPVNQFPVPELPVAVADKLTLGTCHELSRVGVAMMRAMGIPAAIDFTPVYLNNNNSHEWNCVVKDKNTILPFDITSKSLYEFRRADLKFAKVYRRRYSFNKQSHFASRGYCGFLPEYFNNPFIEDVTSAYTSTATVTVPIQAIPRSQYCYLSVFRLGAWVPVSWAAISLHAAAFHNMGTEGLYCPFFIEKDETVSANAPFIVNASGNIHLLQPDTVHVRTVKLTRKFPLSKRKEIFLRKMVGGVFQGADDSLFTNPVTLYTIRELPGECFQEVNIDTGRKFRYLRYLSPPYGYGNVSEIKYYRNRTDADTAQLKGRVIGTQGSIDPYTKKEAAMDNNVLTFFSTEAADSCWVGLVLEQPETIGKIAFLPRNDMNSIQKGKKYELLCWQNEWVSLGEKVADAGWLTYENVPDNTLFWLRCPGEGVEERIFTYENGKQIWW